MIVIVVLQNTLNPINAAERVKINQNWDEIRRAFSQIQLQVNFLAGGSEVDEIIERINNAIITAENGAQQAIDSVNQALSELNLALISLQTATQETNAARDNAISATNDARNAINEISSIMNNFRSLGPWNNTIPYKRNNIVSFNGNGYIALIDNTGVPPTDTSTWDLFVEKGKDGERGPQGEAGASLNIKGSLNDVSQLPQIGEAGDAYTINGDLYVWSYETNSFVNVGQIKGEKGDRGEKGESGYYTLANFQYTIPADSEGQTTIEIPLSSFNPLDHSLLLFINSTVISDDKYSISGRTITLNEPVQDYTQTKFYLNITQGVLIQPLDTINGSSIQDGTITENKLDQILIDKINSEQEEYILPIASSSILGGIKPDGTTLEVDPETGVASVIGGGGGINLAPYAGDLNDLTDNGVYSCNIDDINLNSPQGLYGRCIVVVLKTEIGDVKQIFMYTNSAIAGGIYNRTRSNNSWGDWVIVDPRISSSLNDQSELQVASSLAVKNLNDSKANSAQENLIPLTLSGGWSGKAYCYKDSIGIVHIYLDINNASPAALGVIFTLPVGYRPPVGKGIDTFIFSVPSYTTSNFKMSKVTVNQYSGGVATMDAPFNNIITQLSFRTT